ncbi:hypothetical protein [Actinosynnema mirum]|uniref:hypothetical protein n=1 Tax=Actinosynnema mirum TaxID=40567 RepID=UPI00019AB782|nr:hypothetical protein [Actinosynnema mirum]
MVASCWRSRAGGSRTAHPPPGRTDHLAAVPLPGGRTVLAAGGGHLVRLWDLADEVISLALDDQASALVAVPASPATGGVPLLAVASEIGFAVLEVHG